MKKISILILIFATILLSTGLVYAKGGGLGGEPGSGCADQSITYKYVPPPYMGTVAAHFCTDSSGGSGMCVSGMVEQVGKSSCTGSVPPLTFFKAMTLDEFQSLKPNDIRGACLVPGLVDWSCPPSYDFSDIVGAGDLKWLPDGSFTFNAVIMQLVPK